MKKVKLKLIGMDGNAFGLLAAFSTAARRQGWTRENIHAVRTEATNGDYDHLLRTLIKYTEDTD